MFRPGEGQGFSQMVTQAESNYVIQKNDILGLEVYTNAGEKIVDPVSEISPDGSRQDLSSEPPRYLVDQTGHAKFPLIQEFKAEGLTLRQAEKLLEQEYSRFYQQPFVKLSYSNKRVVVLGALGGQVVPLNNENMKLTEVLALVRGLSNDSKAHNIRVLRGNDVYLADFSTIDGYLKYNYTMQPNDIVYVEPVRRPFSEALRDYGAVITIITSLTTLVVVVIGLN